MRDKKGIELDRIQEVAKKKCVIPQVVGTKTKPGCEDVWSLGSTKENGGKETKDKFHKQV